MAAVGVRFTNPQDASERNEKATTAPEIEKTIIKILFQLQQVAKRKRQHSKTSRSYVLCYSVCK